MASLKVNLRRFVEAEFQLHQTSAGDLVMSGMVALRSPPGLPINFCHLGTLYALDHGKRGRVELREVVEFVLFCNRLREQYHAQDFQHQLEGLFTLQLWKDCSLKGSQAIEMWLLRMVTRNAPVHQFESQPGCSHVVRDSILPLYRLLSAYMMKEMTFHEFFDLMQHAAEQQGMSDLQNEILDNFVPLEIVAAFVEALIAGFQTMMREVGFHRSLIMEEDVRAAKLEARAAMAARGDEEVEEALHDGVDEGNDDDDDDEAEPEPEPPS